MEDFSLPGYDVQELLGFGATGEVWRARERGSGELVALKRLHAAFEPLAERVGESSAEADELRREAALLASVQHDHVVRLRSVIETASGLVLVLDFAEGGSLAALLAARGRFSPGEVVTVGAPLAQALADVHSRGLVHGDVTPANIVFTGEGKPLLADLGIASLAGEPSPVRGATASFADPALLTGAGPPTVATTRAGDVYGLAATCYAMLCGRPPSRSSEPQAPLAGLAPSAPVALIAAIESAMSADLHHRLDAAGFGRALFAAAAPEPVRLVAATAAPVTGAARPAPELTHRVRPTPHTAGVAADVAARTQRRSVRQRERRPVIRRGQLIRRVAIAGLGVALIATAAGGGVLWASHGPRAVAGEPVVSSPSATSAIGRDPDWSAVLGALDSQRDRAFIDADAGELDAVYTPASPALAADRATLAQLVAAGEHAQGLALGLTSVVVSSRTDAQVSILVDDVLPAYDIVGPTGAMTRVAARGQRSWLVVLAAPTAPAATADLGWRIASITSTR